MGSNTAVQFKCLNRDVTCICVTLAPRFRQECEPEDDNGRGSQPVVTGILQGARVRVT